VHLAWGAAAVAGVGTWLVTAPALGSAARRELAQGILTLVGSATLLLVARLTLEQWTTRKMRLSEGRIIWLLGAAAFLIAYREAVEIVLLFRARVLAGPGSELAIAAGLSTGIVLLVALVMVVQRWTTRLRTRLAVLGSSALLTLIALSLLGQGVRSLQEGGHLHLVPVAGGARLSFLGIHPTVEGLAAQGAALLLVVLLAWLDERRGRRAYRLATART
jgi:high-affinity iron transporter